MLRLIVFLLFATVTLGWLYLLQEELALGFYGADQSRYSRECVYVDAYLNLYTFNVFSGNDHFWLHGCPIFHELNPNKT
ncbi:MAG: hypothetical protein AAF217_02445 [Pseudomonadota bacterium]